MTHEQFDEAIKINERIKQLKEVLNEFQGSGHYRLSIVYNGYGEMDSEVRPMNGYMVNYVKDKLEVYTKKFIQELKDELETLNKKIENL